MQNYIEISKVVEEEIGNIHQMELQILYIGSIQRKGESQRAAAGNVKYSFTTIY